MKLRQGLIRLREELGFTQMQLASALQVSFTTINRWENGKSFPNATIARAVMMHIEAMEVSESCKKYLQEAFFPTENLIENRKRQVDMSLANQVLNDSPTAIIVCDVHTYEILYINKTAESWRDIPLDSVRNMTCYKYISGRDEPCGDCFLNRLNKYDFFNSKAVGHSGRVYAVRSKLIPWEGKEAAIAYYTDISDIRNDELPFKSNLNMEALGNNKEALQRYASTTVRSDLQKHVLEQNETGVFAIDADSHEIYYMNNSVFTLLGENQDSYIGKTCVELLSMCGKNCDSCPFADNNTKDKLNSTINIKDKWLLVHSEKKPWMGRNVVTIYLQDVTQQVLLQQQVEESNNKLQDVFSNMPGGVCLYRWDGKRLKTISISHHFSDLLGLEHIDLDTLDFDTIDREIMHKIIHPEDFPQLGKFMVNCFNNPGKGYSHSFRIWNNHKNSYCWILATVNVVAHSDYSLVYINYTDIDEAKRLEADLRNEEEMLRDACNFANIWTWVYDINNNIAYPSPQLQEYFGMHNVLENFPQSWFDMGYVMPNFIELQREKIQSIKNGSNSEEFEIQIRHKDGSIHWSRILLHRLEKNPNLCSCTSQLIDQEKIMEARVKLETNKLLSSDNNMIGYVITNLTQDIVIERDRTRDVARLADIGKTMEYSVEKALSYFIESDREKYLSLHNREKLLSAYKEGTTEFEFLGHGLDNRGSYRWTRFVLKLIQEPFTGDIYLYEYVYDIHESKMLEEITATIAKVDYECIASVNLHTNQISIISVGKLGDAPEVYNYDYDAKRAIYTNSCVVESDRKMFLEKSSIDYIANQLADNDATYEFFHHVIEPDGTIGARRNKFKYYDKTQGIGIMTRTNVTEAMRQEEIRANELSKALEQTQKALKIAEVATKAKTEFLSRMSHDMRTPLNAIIGLSALTLDAAKEPDTVRDYMSKMRSASDFLLGLVNDILDMAKIEDGSVVLNPEPYSYSEFLGNMRTMFLPQCEAKGITLKINEAKSNPVVSADKLRLNQVFFNIFSNAVKYTPAGGTITYSVENLKFDGDYVSSDFIIEDNGIGMSEEYQKHLFEPFRQESNAVTAELQGSGLGLSITKQLAELMGGTIQIESKKGVGTRVTLSFRVKYIEKDHKEVAITPASQKDNDIILKDKYILVAEDHPLNAMIARKLLEKKGIIVSHAENGKIAVEMFEASKENQFDAILMDVRMPEMSGLDATRAIRALNREDATTIPIIAMSANAYAEDVQKSIASGMNDHIAKPVNPQLLYKTLADYFRKMQ